MLNTCVHCNKLVDIDGFSEHGEPTLFYCACGSVLELEDDAFSLREIPKSEVDLEGLGDRKNLFVRASRRRRLTEGG